MEDKTETVSSSVDPMEDKTEAVSPSINPTEDKAEAVSSSIDPTEDKVEAVFSSVDPTEDKAEAVFSSIDHMRDKKGAIAYSKVLKEFGFALIAKSVDRIDRCINSMPPSNKALQKVSRILQYYNKIDTRNKKTILNNLFPSNSGRI